MTLGLRRQDANADLFLEDADGNVLHSSTKGGTRREEIAATLEAGTYHVRVAARKAGDNDYLLRARAEDPPAPAGAPDPNAQTPDAVPQPTVSASVSEPEGGDLPADTSTTGRLAVGSSATGEIATKGDVDWFAVTLEAGKPYRFDLKGSFTGDGTMYMPYLRGIHDAKGNLVAGPADHDSGQGTNVRIYLTPSESGTYYVAAGGLYNIYTGTYTVAVTNDTDDFSADTATAGQIAVGGSVTGEIERRGDADWLAVTLDAGKTYMIDLKGRKGKDTGDGTLADPYLRGIHDAKGKLVAGTEDDDSGGFLNSRAYITPAESGTYYVAAGGRDNKYMGTYTVTVTNVTDDFSADTATAGKIAVGGAATGVIESPGDVDWFAITLEKGKTYWFNLKGSHSGDGTLKNPHLRGIHDAKGNLVAGTADDYGGAGSNSRAYFTPAESGTYYVAAGGIRDHMGGTYEVSAVSATLKGTVAVGGSATGSIEDSGDVDWFRTTLSAGTWYEVGLKGAGTDPAGENRLEIFDSNGNRLASDTTAGWGWDSSRLLFKAPAAGTYYIAASETGSNIDGSVRPDGGDYELSLAVARPAGYGEIAGFLTDGYWRADGRRAFDLDSDRTLDVDISGLTAKGQQMAKWAFDAWSYATGIRFRFVDERADIVLDDEVGWGHANTVVKDGTVVSGTINFRKFSGKPAVNDSDFKGYLEEIGHVLGLGHAGRYNGVVVFPNGVEFPNDTMQATVTSYFSASGNPWNPNVNTFVDGGWYYPVTPMIADMLAVRELYGAPAAVNAGDTVYGWKGNADGYLGNLLTDLTGGKPDEDVYRHKPVSNAPIALTLYDTDGTDTLDLRTDTRDQRIDLRPEGVSTVFGRNGKIFIGPETVIENVVAGSGNDHVIGNGAANRIEGRKGNDTLDGGGGDDRLTGGAGKDVFVFGPGNGSDTVTDFTDGKDRIDLRAFTAVKGFSDVDAEAVSGGVPDRPVGPRRGHSAAGGLRPRRPRSRRLPVPLRRLEVVIRRPSGRSARAG